MISNRFVNNRKLSLFIFISSFLFLITVTIAGILLEDSAAATDFSQKNLPPSPEYIFGTDWLGRNMLLRTITGISMSIQIGLITAAASSVIAFFLGTAAVTMGKAVDSSILFMTDLVMGIPHILLLILISFACGRGFWGVVIGVSLTHWPTLTRVIRSEVLQLKQSGYIKCAQKLGQSRRQIIRRHMLPHILPQYLAGLILLFPHAILHEASLTFLGFGLSPQQPAIGIILSESMRYLSMGNWWLALFPGALLVFTVILFDLAGGSFKRLISNVSAHD
jgi:ABC-type dipeptide/oligopeptide/nickel transport system permease subunit